jgi:hypothetical protein
VSCKRVDRDWYVSAARRNNAMFILTQAVIIGSGAATILLSALLKPAAFANWGSGRVLLVILPAIGTFVSTLSVQFALRQMASLRENGRIKVEELSAESRRRFASATTNEQYAEVHQWLASEITLLEREQSRDFYGLHTAAGPARRRNR